MTVGAFTVDRDVISRQTKGCAVAVQIGFTSLLWHPRWAGKRSAAAVHVDIAAPIHNPQIGYQRRGWALRLG